MVEKRQGIRETTITPAISCLVELPDGTTLEGLVEDLSDHGAGISGTTKGLRAGDAIELLLIVHADQRVAFQAEVKHVDAEGGLFGVEFKSGPKRVNADDAGSSKMCCGHKQNTLFCAHCGRRLSKTIAPTTAHT